MKIQTKTKLVTVLTSVIIGLVLMSPTTMIPNVVATSSSHPNVSPVPVLSTSEKQSIINMALTIPGLQNWSHDWQYVTNGFLGNNKLQSDFQWQYAIVVLKAPSSSAPVSCSEDWWARIVIDMNTMKVLRATYPTMESHPCVSQQFLVGGSHGWSTATQNDVNTTAHHYFGNYAELTTPSYTASTIYQHLNKAFVGFLLNAFFTPSSSSYCSSIDCLEQAGWTINACGEVFCLPVNSTDIIFVDQSTYGDASGHLTSLDWINGYTSTLDAEIDCAYTSPDYGIVTDNGTNMDTETTKIPCTTHQNSTSTDTNMNQNSVYFENADSDSTQSWSSDITSTVSATSAQEHNGSATATLSNWGHSHNVDFDCNFHPSASKVITGSLAGGTTATWSSLNKQPKAC